MTPQEIQSALEAIIYAADEPATIQQLTAAIGAEKTEVQAALDLLVASYAADDRGIEIRKVAGGYKYYTKAQHHEVVRKFIKSLRPPLRLTMPALETLAVIAYKQPVTIPEIQEIRGVSASGVIKTLLERRLITTAGRKPVIGRPILYRTSKEFMMRFGLSDLDELPSLKEFEQLAQAALGSDSGIAPMEPELAGEMTEAAETKEPSVAAEDQLPVGSNGEPAANPAVADTEASHSDSGEQTAEAQSTSENTMSAAAGAGGTHEASNVVNRGEESEQPVEKVTLSEEGPPFPPSS
jgi:segregation and condensation protein B